MVANSVVSIERSPSKLKGLSLLIEVGGAMSAVNFLSLCVISFLHSSVWQGTSVFVCLC